CARSYSKSVMDFW
nr:immunoglobulin heavy chain junction region [Mus musculus]MBK4184652.1 immunoglobulin heavy chain junction region [Mus musculus]